MPSVSESVDVAISPEALFEFIADAPERATTFIPGLNRIDKVSSPQAAVGQTWEFEFNWFGLVIAGDSRCTKYDKPSLYQFQTVTGNPSTWTYRFEPVGSRTRLTLDVEFELPQSQLARFAAAGVLERMNRDRAREIVDNLKALMEP